MKSEFTGKNTGRLILIFFSLIFFYRVLLILAWSIPASNARAHLEESRELIAEEGNYKRFFSCIDVAQTENWSDGYWWNMAYHADEGGGTVRSAFQANYCEIEGANPPLLGVENLIEILNAKADERKISVEKKSYGRYWQGMTVILFPLLYFFNISQIRALAYLVMLFLFSSFLYYIYFRLGKIYCIITFLGLVSVHFYAVPISMQYVSCFSVMLLFSLWCLRKDLPETGKLCIAFFVAGSIVNYIDFLTTPLITFTVPVTILVTRYRKEKGYHSRDSLRVILSSGVFWGLGYTLTWISKWVLTWIVSGNADLFLDISNHIAQRASLNSGFLQHILDFIIGSGHNVLGLLESPATLPLFFIGILGAGKMIREAAGKEFLITFADYGLITILPFLWMFLFAEHSRVHYHFVYRILFGSILAVFFAWSVWNDNRKEEDKVK